MSAGHFSPEAASTELASNGAASNEVAPIGTEPAASAVTAESAFAASDALASSSATRGASMLSGRGLWFRVGLAVLLLCASAAARQWQAQRVNQTLRDGRIPPFPLKEIPETLGDWEGTSASMDPHVARATGATDKIVRTYQHRRTGQKINLIVLFGPSSEMYVHTPENCYPASGFSLTSGPNRRQITSGKKRFLFNSLVYTKGQGSSTEIAEVYYTWYYSGRWNPNLVTPKWLERIPGMFKVHVERQVLKSTELEMLDIGNPTESFLSVFMREIDARVARSQTPRATAK